jgi:hypothetical protein
LGQLTTYLTQVRRLLHDPNAQNFSDAELTDYINAARRRVASDTYCLRQLDPGINILQGVESYPINSTVHSQFQGRVVGVIGIDLYWGNTRYPMFYAPWTAFSRNMRFYSQMQTRPTVFTRQGALTIYVGYTPDQNYVTDWDIAIYPNPLVNDSSTEELVVPYLDVVQFWAAHLAKYKEQAMGESDIFETKYKKELARAARSFQLFVSNPVNFFNQP